MGIGNYLTAQIIFYFKTSTRKEKKKVENGGYVYPWNFQFIWGSNVKKIHDGRTEVFIKKKIETKLNFMT